MCKNQSIKLWELLNTEPYINTLGSCIEKYRNGERTAHLLFTIAQKYTDRNESENAGIDVV